MISYNTNNKLMNSVVSTEPFNHIVIDNFLDNSVANLLADEFPDFNSNLWYSYESPLEIKKTMNFWDRFPPTTYQIFWDFCSAKFTSILSLKFNTTLFPDIGLNGGGWHIHGSGGKLNVHQDYSIHPKIKMQRKLNIIYHLSKDWDPSWGGGLQLWSHNPETNKPKELVKEIDVKFNRAVIFDTTQNSWHGFFGELTCPQNVYRKTLAVYYVQYPDLSAQERFRALYAPSKEQENDPEVLRMIEERAKVRR